LIPQTWHYGGIPLGVGRPELVATHPDYRNRGLVRELFAVVHERSVALGHHMQVITGIPYFYRQFGYTMAMELGDWATLPLHAITDPVSDSVSEPEVESTPPVFTLRPATLADIPDLMRWYAYHAREKGGREPLVTEIRSHRIWQHEIAGHSPQSMRARYYFVIVKHGDVGVGYVALSPHFAGTKHLYCNAWVVGEEASYLETFDDLLRAIKGYLLAAYGKSPAILAFAAGTNESLFALVGRRFGGNVRQHTYKWYVRVPNAIRFLQQIAPVMERRLEGSGAHRYTGELKIGFYDLTGVSLRFEGGRVMEITPLQGKDGYDLAFPWHMFWNVVFGDASADEITKLLPDVWLGNPMTALLFNTLFPKQKSWLDGLG
jgi:hypothetical protein